MYRFRTMFTRVKIRLFTGDTPCLVDKGKGVKVRLDLNLFYRRFLQARSILVKYAIHVYNITVYLEENTGKYINNLQ